MHLISTTTPTTNFPAMQGQFGSRLVTYSTQIPPQAIEGLLGHDPRSRFWKKLNPELENIYSFVQRTTNPKRLRNIKDYAQYRFSPDAYLIGAFPAVSIAIQRHVDFRPISDAPDMAGVGNIQIDMSTRNTRVIVDGLGRISAVLDLLESSFDEKQPEEDKRRLTELMKTFTIPLVIYAPHPDAPILSRSELGQLFYDFNFLATAVPSRIAISLDMSDPYIMVTNALGKHCSAIADNGGMEERSASLGKKSSAVVVQQVLLRFVRGAMEGSSFQESNKSVEENPNLTLENIREATDSLSIYLEAFANSMGDDFHTQRKSMHLTSTGWQSLGVIFHDITRRVNGYNIREVATQLGRLDWSREGTLWKDIMTEKVNKQGVFELVLRTAGATGKRQMVEILRNQLGIDRALKQITTELP